MDEHKLDLAQLRAEIPLAGFLEKLGHVPIRRSGGELFYLSMLRDNDTAPSFCVNEKMDLWYDHGLAKGGSIIDLALLLWPELGFRQSMERILEVSGNPVLETKSAGGRQTEMSLKFPSYQILEDRPIGTNHSISAYLRSRGILSQADPFIRELYYSVKTATGEQRKMFAAGWQNEAGGWEVRNEHFKGCLGKKSMSAIPGSPDQLTVFEGMMDFLSWRLEHPGNESSILILNSVAFLAPAIQRAARYRSVSVFFDHDPSGRKATAAFLAQVSYANDRSGIYEGHNDYNEKIQHQLGDARQQRSSDAPCEKIKKR
ncbi:hypothetical protein EZ449_14190 [Pedobacter frigidisoli]|uniref:Toprim-like n=1 Tax=Pedobacter frigidisoli TaxID=2530455 RepID=A0A4R0NZ23_9SPHI|nr:toprim domain-containing protein [Pedobacter frigidisoli]TCD07681.1 hypothetical protein EZ449_14190 [Pedobacter frigidisoli]